MAGTDSLALLSLLFAFPFAFVLGTSAGIAGGGSGTRRTTLRCVMHFDWCVLLQSFLAIHDHLIARRDARRDQRNISLRQIDLHRLQVGLAALHGVNIRALRAT